MENSQPRSSDVPRRASFDSGSSPNPTDPLPVEALAQSPEQPWEAKHNLLPPPVQMIGEDGAFYRFNVKRINMSDSCTLVSIIGPQCSGKSYLLNHIFGTNFEVMNASKGRHQTTKGIWLSKSTIANFAVLDVQGSDGKGKKDQIAYERQIALFLLQLSNLIMVNMRLQDVNRELGGSSTLLPEIFQEKSKISSAPTNILVVIRGYDYETPVDLLQSDVLENMKKLWKSSVPHGSPMFEECIETFVVALPDKSEEQDFKRGVFDLKEKLLKGLSTSIHQDFASKANNIWQFIRENQQINLLVPDHTVATSTINCERAVQFIIDNLESFQGHDSLVKSASSKDFWDAYACLSISTTTYFETETEMCDILVRNKKRQELKRAMLARLDPVLTDIINKQNQEMQEKYMGIIREQIRQAEDPMLIVNDSVKKCMEELAKTCTDISSVDTDAYDRIFESCQIALSDYARNEANLMQQKCKTKKSELARDEMEKKASSLYRETEAFRQEMIRQMEELLEANRIGRERAEREINDALVSNQRAREDSQKKNEDLTRDIELLTDEEAMLKKKIKDNKDGLRKLKAGFDTVLKIVPLLAASYQFAQ